MRLVARQEAQAQTCAFVSHRQQPEVDLFFFFFFERFNGITLVTSSHRRPARAFPVLCEEENRARKGNIRLPVAVRGLRTSALKVAYYSFCTMRALMYARAAQGTQEHHACAKSREPAEEIPRAQK